MRLSWQTRENIKITIGIFFGILLFSILTLALEEKPHKVEIEGHEYIEETRYNGHHYQIIRNHSPECGAESHNR